MNKNTLKTAGWVVAMLALPAVSNAAIIFSSLGPGGTYVCCSGLGVGAFNGGLYTDAGAFTPSYTTTLTEIDVPVFAEPGNGSNSMFNLSLYSDSSGSPGATPIETWSDLTAPSAPSAGTASLVTSVMPLTTIDLLAGQQYWVVVGPAAANTFVLWNTPPDLSVAYPFAYLDPNSVFGNTWIVPTPQAGQVSVAFEVQGTAPEPSTMLLLPAGFASLFLIRKLRGSMVAGPSYLTASIAGGAQLSRGSSSSDTSW